ncbi:hypothetical protein KCU68_g21806, partial [Aureobasidium melanogenum]
MRISIRKLPSRVTKVGSAAELPQLSHTHLLYTNAIAINISSSIHLARAAALAALVAAVALTIPDPAHARV